MDSRTSDAKNISVDGRQYEIKRSLVALAAPGDVVAAVANRKLLIVAAVVDAILDNGSNIGTPQTVALRSGALGIDQQTFAGSLTVFPDLTFATATIVIQKNVSAVLPPFGNYLETASGQSIYCNSLLTLTTVHVQYVEIIPEPSASFSTISSSAATAPADNATLLTITVTAKDRNGAPMVGDSVVLAATGAGNTIVQPAAVTNGSGVATGTIKSSAAGAKVVSAAIDGITINSTVTVTFT